MVCEVGRRMVTVMHWRDPKGRNGRVVDINENKRAIYTSGKEPIDVPHATIIHPAIGRIKAKKGEERAPFPQIALVLRDMWNIHLGGDALTNCSLCKRGGGGEFDGPHDDDVGALISCPLCRLSWHPSCLDLLLALPMNLYLAPLEPTELEGAEIPEGFHIQMCELCQRLVRR